MEKKHQNYTCDRVRKWQEWQTFLPTRGYIGWGEVEATEGDGLVYQRFTLDRVR
jgi:hypothetical protein